MDQLPFFVYGTLKRGERNQSVWPAAPEKVTRATTVGALYDFGPYPCLLQGDDTVSGEAWEINEDDFPLAVAALDRLEGFDQGGENLYLRVTIDCTTDAGIITAYTYLYNQPLTNHHQRIQPDQNGIVSWSQKAGD